MTNYYDVLIKQYDRELANVVSHGLNQLHGNISNYYVRYAVRRFKFNQDKI